MLNNEVTAELVEEDRPIMKIDNPYYSYYIVLQCVDMYQRCQHACMYVTYSLKWQSRIIQR